mmetsp:Transcript_131815/g.233072  ORF Transcript_131815/g.233072 Transcript_131815/m.233072 type:complete len:201 (-) Transcript_131815:2306-2908(-)
MSLHFAQHSASSCSSDFPQTRVVATVCPCISWKLAPQGVKLSLPQMRFHPPRLLALFAGLIAAFFLSQQYVVLGAPCATVNGIRSRTQNSHKSVLAHKSPHASSKYASIFALVFIVGGPHTATLLIWAPLRSMKVCFDFGTGFPQPCLNPPRRARFFEGPPMALLSQHALGLFAPSPAVEPIASRTQKSHNVSFLHNAQQ